MSLNVISFGNREKIEGARLFDKYFGIIDEEKRNLHFLMHANFINKAFIENMYIISGLDKKYGEEYLERYYELFDDKSSKLKFLKNFHVNCEMKDYYNFLNNLEFKYDSSNLDSYMDELCSDCEFTKFSFILFLLSNGKKVSSDSSSDIVSLGYSDCFLPDLTIGSFLDVDNIKIDYEKLFSLNFDDLKKMLDGVYESAIILDSKGNVNKTVKGYLEEFRDEILEEQKSENVEKYEKYQKILLDNHFKQIYSLDFPNNYTVVVYYNSTLDAFIEDIVFDNKSLVMSSDGKSAIKYRKEIGNKVYWLDSDLYMFSFDDLKLNVSSLNGFLFGEVQSSDVTDNLDNYYCISEKLDKIDFDDNYLDNVIKVLCDGYNLESINGYSDDIDVIFNDIKFMYDILLKFSSDDNGLGLTEKIILDEQNDSNVLKIDRLNSIPFGFYASQLDSAYCKDYVSSDFVKDLVPDCGENVLDITLLYNALRFVNNVLCNGSESENIESINYLYDESLSPMNPFLNGKRKSKVIAFPNNKKNNNN